MAMADGTATSPEVCVVARTVIVPGPGNEPTSLTTYEAISRPTETELPYHIYSNIYSKKRSRRVYRYDGEQKP